MFSSAIIQRELPQGGDKIHDIEIESSDQKRARATIYLPKDDKLRQYPALICILHYAGQPTRFYGRPLLESVFLPVFRKYGAILVAPESINGQWHTEENESFIMALIESIQKTYGTDPARIVLGGYSMGALGTFHFLNNYPNIFCAGIALAGFPSGEMNPTSPVHLLLSQNDEVFDYKTFISKYDDLKNKDYKISFSKVPATSHYDVKTFSEHLPKIEGWLNDLWN
jgi:predicted peptidase